VYAPRIYCILRLSSVWQATRESRKLLHDNKNAIVWSWLIEEGCGLKGGGVGRCGSTLTCSWWFCHCDNDAIVWLPPDCPSQWLIYHRRSCHLWVDLRGSEKSFDSTTCSHSPFGQKLYLPYCMVLTISRLRMGSLLVRTSISSMTTEVTLSAESADSAFTDLIIFPWSVATYDLYYYKKLLKFIIYIYAPVPTKITS